jgi:hypothetical protein
MSYSGPVQSTDSICFPRDALLRIQPRAAGPMRTLITTSGPAHEVPVPLDRGLLVIDPRFDRLPVGPGWEPRF